jgi:arylsulfatase A
MKYWILDVGFWLFCCFLISCGSEKMPQSETKPNIVLIMVDDMGYGDTGCYGNSVIKTPNIDALAADGLRFTDFYSSGAWCVPSRKGLMTGIHPQRASVGRDKLAEKTTIAEMLKEQGYATAILGKWHLGLDDGRHPLDQGFDYYYGTPGSNDVPAPEGKSQNYDVFQTAKEEDWPVPLVRNREQIELPAKQSLFTQRYTSEAIRMILSTIQINYTDILSGVGAIFQRWRFSNLIQFGGENGVLFKAQDKNNFPCNSISSIATVVYELSGFVEA